MNADEATTPPQMDVIAIAVNSEMPPDEIQVIENLRRHVPVRATKVENCTRGVLSGGVITIGRCELRR